MFNCCEFQLLPQSELPPTEEGEPPDVPLGNHGLPCLLHHLLPRPACWEWAFLHSYPWLTVSPFLTSILVVFFWALYPLFNVVCCGGGPHYLHHSVGMSWPLGLSCVFHNSICNLPVEYLQLPLPVLFYQPNWLGLSSWIQHPWHFPRGALLWGIIIQRIRLPSLGKDYRFGNLLFKTLLEHVFNYQATPCIARWWLVASPSSKVTLTWMQ